MVLLLTALLTACSGGADSLDTPAAPPMTRIDQATVDKYTQPLNANRGGDPRLAPSAVGTAGEAPSVDGAIEHVVHDNPAAAPGATAAPAADIPTPGSPAPASTGDAPAAAPVAVPQAP